VALALRSIIITYPMAQFGCKRFLRMSWNHKKVKNTRLDNSTYNVMVALGTEADFLHSTIDTYIADAERVNKTKLVDVWNNIKKGKQEHLDMLKNCLENEVQEGELNK
jgi:hypothetical protein